MPKKEQAHFACVKLFPITLMCIFFVSCKKYDHTWMIIGDSITSSDGKEFETGPQKGESIIGYQTIINSKNKNSIKLTNEGYSGFSLAGHERSVYQEVKDNNFSNHEVITIFVGTNDFKLNKPIISKDSLESFRYCYTSLINRIQSQNKKARLYLITPLKRNNDGYTTTSTNKAGHKLLDYRNEVVRIGLEKDLKVIDLYNESGIDESNLQKFTVDGLHLNNKGYELIGNVLNEQIKFPVKDKGSH